MTRRTYRVVLLVGACAAGPALAAARHTPPTHTSATPRITRFRRGLSGFPLSITAGPRRTLWFSEGLQPNLRGAVGRISTSGKIKEFRRGINGHMYAGSAPIVMG